MSNTGGVRGVTFPGDLVLVAGLGILTAVIGMLGVSGVAGQMVFGALGVLFAPGYALVAVFFPEEASTVDHDTAAAHGDTDSNVGNGRRLRTTERVLLAVGASVCLVPLVGIMIAFTPWQVGPAPVLGTVGVGTTVLAVGAVVIRRQIPPQERFSPGVAQAAREYKNRLYSGGSGSVLPVLLVVGIVVAAGGIGTAALTTERGEQFTEFYLITEGETTGEALASGYPGTVTRGDDENMTVGVTNEEGQTASYTIVVLLQSFRADGQISEVERLETFSTSVRPGETWERVHTISPEMTGKDLRLTYLLYVGSPPENAAPTADSAYRSTHIWLDVSP